MIKEYTIAMFGESERGEFNKAYFCQNLPQLVDYLGHPPPESQGLHYAVQALLFEHKLIFFRVKEEGFSIKDYFRGLKMLRSKSLTNDLSAICAPGVGDLEIIDAFIPICEKYHSILLTTESDLYDYLTNI